eukprot:TRINITY_DN67362_c11_g1_i1.p2 TRINITY_DN67362_c11_g1~~TRINITY_DN67362_c11_g1_i1.p2  ORF type:complete len:168 (-),score=7.28 TRINITY_DN67362_c11_g1_i1:163-666(-)
MGVDSYPTATPIPSAPPMAAGTATTGLPAVNATYGGDMYTQGHWNSPLFGCFSDIPLCITTFCCPCLSYARTRSAMNGDGVIWKPCLIHIAIWVHLHCLFGPCILEMMVRRELRERFDIPFREAEDCLAACCCLPCSQWQVAKQVNTVGCETPPPMPRQQREPLLMR